MIIKAYVKSNDEITLENESLKKYAKMNPKMIEMIGRSVYNQSGISGLLNNQFCDFSISILHMM